MKQYKKRLPGEILADFEQNNRSIASRLLLLIFILIVGLTVLIYISLQYSNKPIKIDSDTFPEIQSEVVNRIIKSELINAKFTRALEIWKKNTDEGDAQCYCFENRKGTQRCISHTINEKYRQNWQSLLSMISILKKAEQDQCVF